MYTSNNVTYDCRPLHNIIIICPTLLVQGVKRYDLVRDKLVSGKIK